MTTPSERITFTVPLPPKALRRNRETASRGYKAACKREFQEHVWIAGYEKIGCRCAGGPMACTHPWERAKVHYRYRSTHRTDEDNIISGMKYALDVLKVGGPRPLGIIVDDDQVSVSAVWEKASTKADQYVLVEVERLA